MILGDSVASHFPPEVPQVPAALAWAQQAAAARVNEDLARMVGEPRKGLLHCIQYLKNSKRRDARILQMELELEEKQKKKHRK